ncbi:MAG: ABC transporter permease [Paracoccaceae bacterium]
MRPADCLGLAWRALRASGVRSGLTTLGIVIGVAAFLAMDAVGEGAREDLRARVRAMGADVLMAVPGSLEEGATALGAGSAPTLSERDAAALAALPEIGASAAIVDGDVTLVRGRANWRARLAGVEPAYFAIHRRRPAEGRLLDGSDLVRAEKVVVLGAGTAARLFGNTPAVGATLRIGPAPFRVVGRLAPIGSSAEGRDLDDVAYVPITTAKRRVLGAAFASDRDAVTRISLRPSPGESVAGATEAARRLLRMRHGIGAGQADDFSLLSMDALLETEATTADSIAAMLALVSGISLVVGGIGVMSTLLVAIAERRREIGLRLALGARRSDIRNQFLAEALMICAAGGTAGVALGAAAAGLLALLGGWSVAIHLDAVAISLGVASATGLVFGVVPAVRASRLDPVAALRGL